MSIRIVLADDHKVVREGIRALLEEEPDFEIVGEAANGLEAVSVVERVQPNILLLDLSMPKLHGIQVIERVAVSSPDTKVVVLSIHDSDSYKNWAVEAGASGYVVKSAGSKEVIAAIRRVCDQPRQTGRR